MSKAQGAALAGALVLAWMTVYGGEYSVRDWWRVRQQLVEERAAVDSLRAELDSLARIARLLESDPAAQERAAREEFGMIRDGETIYRLVAPRDTTRR